MGQDKGIGRWDKEGLIYPFSELSARVYELYIITSLADFLENFHMALDVILRLFPHADVGSAYVRWNVTLLVMWAVQWQPGGGSDRVRACEQRAP